MGVNTCSEEQFVFYKKNWNERLLAIQLPEDLNSITAKMILSQLDEAYTSLRFDLGEIEASRDKTDSLIRQKERSEAVGKNEDDRKKNATNYIEAFPIEDGDTINLYEFSRRMNYRYTIIKAFVDIVTNKQQRLITISGFLKIDKDLGGGIY